MSFQIYKFYLLSDSWVQVEATKQMWYQAHEDLGILWEERWPSSGIIGLDRNNSFGGWKLNTEGMWVTDGYRVTP